MLLFESLAPADSVAGDRLVLAFETRCKSSLRARLASGEECGLFLPRSTVMRGGDKLAATISLELSDRTLYVNDVAAGSVESRRWRYGA